VSRPRQLAAINQIGRAAEQIRKLQELGALAERRAGEAEENIQPLKRLLAEKEDRLVAALDAVLHERKRYQDLERRSADMLDRAQAMIAEADQRIQASEKRASVAEEHLEALQAAVTRAFID
jgi:chromosome segregation ATPase